MVNQSTVQMMIIRKARVVIRSCKTFRQVILTDMVQAESISKIRLKHQCISSIPRFSKYLQSLIRSTIPTFPSIRQIGQILYAAIGLVQGGADIYFILILEAPLLSIWGLATKNPESPPNFMHQGSATQTTFHPRSCIVVYQESKETLEKLFFRIDVIRLDCNVDPWFSFALSAVSSDPPPHTPSRPRSGPGPGLQSCSID